MVAQEKPDVISVSELGLLNSHNAGLTFIDNYHFEHDSLLTNGRSRAALWVHKFLIYSHLKQFDDHKNPIVGLRIGFPHKRKVNIISYYRQWKTAGNHRDNKLELSNFESVTSRISNLLEANEETILVGDINIDLLAINKSEDKKNGLPKKPK